MKRSLIFCAFCLINLISYSQGTIRGIIKDETGQPVIGASVVLKSNRSYGVTTDLDGNFSLKINDSTAQVILISFISYQTIEEIVNPKNGEVVVKKYFLVPSAQGIKGVEVTAKAVKSREYYTEMVKKNSAITLDYISSETMKKTGDNNVTAAVSRVTGVSTNNNGLITVRGIGDRYVKTTINGLRIPTLDPYTNNIKLDLFPSSLVDNIFITKTVNPDLPGDFAGAYLSVETKDYPEQLAINVETQFGYNNQSTFNDVLTSQTSKTDWLGYDSGLRSHNHNNFVSANMDPTQFQELEALGLGNYYQSIGVNENTPWNETYFKLGLVELHLLAPAQFDDGVAVANAKNSFETGNYHSDAFKIINAHVPESAKSFPNNWNTYYRQAPLNFSQTFSIGNQITLFGKPLGFITGFRYGSMISYDPNASSNRQETQEDSITIKNKYSEHYCKEINGWNALANLAYKLNSNNSISFLFMPNFIGTNNVRNSVDISNPLELNLSSEQIYESRRQLVYQLKSEHYLPASKMKIEFGASYTTGKSETPDFKKLEYTQDPATGIAGIGQDVNRSYRYLDEDVFDSKLSVEFPISNTKSISRKLKFGVAYQDNRRDSKQYDYFIRYGPKSSPSLGNTGIEDFFTFDKFDFRSGVFNNIPYSTFDMYYVSVDNPNDHTIGYSKIYAGFGMLDYEFTNRIRVSGGLRVEQAKMFTDAFKYDSLNYAYDDSRRQFGADILMLRPGHLDEISYLPSINFIYKLKMDETSPYYLRANFSQSVARPSIRELTDVIVYDFDLRARIYGNSDLKMVHVNNYDLRFESYFHSGDNLSLSVFYKDFKDHIEIADAPDGYTWRNVDKSNVIGIELEGKKILTKHFEFFANVTLVKSSTTYMQQAVLFSNGVRTYIPIGEKTRTMFGQAPYVVNAMINYNAEKPGINISLNYNIQGPRLFIAHYVEEYEVYELPRHQLDTKITKKLGKHFLLSLNIKDILNEPVRRSYNHDDWAVDFDNYQYGTNFNLGIAYKL
jgi:hypothetical protein